MPEVIVHKYQNPSTKSQTLCILKIIFFLVWNLGIFGIWDLQANDSKHACSECFSRTQKSLLTQIEASESAFAQYRWLEKNIRRLYYGPLWQSRIDLNDPLDKMTRAKGRQSEEDLLEVLSSYETKSKDLVSRVISELKMVENSEPEFRKCQPEQIFIECIQKTLVQMAPVIREIEKAFDHAFESDRDYKRDVSLTAGSRSGLYPEDVLEPASDHTEFFSRFENERHQQLFEQDEMLMQHYETLRRLVLENLASPDCCYQIERKELGLDLKVNRE